MTKYTTVEEMTEKVNRLNEQLHNALTLAKELMLDNERNRYNLLNRSEEAMNEQRPLTIEQRIHEAKRQALTFESIVNLLCTSRAIIGITY